MTLSTANTTSRLEAIMAATEESELAVYKRLELSAEGGRGCTITDSEGREYLDLYAGHAVALTGHAHPKVSQAICDQARKLVFYSSAAYSSVRARASRRLLEQAPIAGSRVFHAVSGSEANEVALKLARRSSKRRKVIAFEGAFHGRTLGALALCGIPRYRATAFARLDPDVQILPFHDPAALSAIDDETAAVFIEPIQSLFGARRASDEFLMALSQRTRRCGAALVFDEVQTGLGRCGSFFYGDRIGVAPDMITLAKGLASGVPAAAVIVGPDFAEVEAGEQGSTFGGGPIAMAALEATLAVIADEGLVENARIRGQEIRRGLESIAGVVEVRGRGLLIGLRADRSARRVRDGLLERGILTGLSADQAILRLLPPLVLSGEEVELSLEAIAAVLAGPKEVGS